MQTEEQIIKKVYRKASDDVKHIIASSEWLKRVKEIGQKYSLTDTQVDALGYEVLFTFLNIQSAEFLSETIEEELEISSILAEQIKNEVEDRIFTWATKKIEQKNLPTTHENTLDIPPPNLPSEDLAEETPVLWTNQAPVASAQETAHTILHEQVTPATPTPQQHEGFYSFKTAPVVQPEPTPVAPQVPKPSFIENKLSQPVKPASPVTPPQSYTTDPYREPLE